MKRIIVLGNSGTGKTTLGRILSKKLNITPLHLDAIYWLPNWNHINKELFIRKLVTFFKKNESWVIDGNYSNSESFDLRLKLADTIIYLDYETKVSIDGIVSRERQYNKQHRSDMAEGCIEKIDNEFLDYVSNFNKFKGKYIKGYIQKYKKKKTVLIFNNRDQLNTWLNSI